MGRSPFNKTQPPRWAMYVLLVLPVLWLVASVNIVVAVSQALDLPELDAAILLGITLGLSVAFGVVAIVYALRRL